MSRAFNSFGLVLSGGGARGAYEVGVAKYLADHNYVPAAYSGASIGALNAVFLGTAPSFQEGVNRLEGIWSSIRHEEVVKLNNSMFAFGLLHAMFTRAVLRRPELLALQSLLDLAAEHSKYVGTIAQISSMLRRNPLYAKLQEGLLDNGFLRTLLERELSLDRSGYAAPIWISAYPSKGTTHDILAYVLSSAGIKDNPESEYFELGQIAREERLSLVLASAAIPVVYSSQIIQGKRYIDGGVGGRRTARGNTPLAPLAAAGMKYCIVVNLSDGSMFNRHEYPETTIIEVRPETTLHPDGVMSSLLDFRTERIQNLIALGYEDTRRCISNALLSVELVHEGRRSAYARDEAIRKLDHDGFDEMMKRI